MKLIACRAFSAAALLLAAASAASAQSLAGTWDATLQIHGVATPFRLELSGDNAHLTGTLFNGEERYPSTSGHFADGKLVLEWDYYAATLTATYQDGAFDGHYAGTRIMAGPFAVHAVRAPEQYDGRGLFSPPPNIDGVWWIPTKSGKGEQAWRFVVQQKDSSGLDLSVAILRVDGDTGAIEGTYRDGKWTLSKFDGARAYLLEVTPKEDGSLDILQDGKTHMTAYRPERAKAMGLPEPTDPNGHTHVQDPDEPFRFRFPDLTGRMVANTDIRFKDKVVVVEIMGSWCPNCHDEAPFLAELYAKYKDRGAEVVTLSFEEPDQLQDAPRLKAFVKRYGIKYPVLLGGNTDDAPALLPQLVNWNTWPCTIFLDRTGRVRAIHAGFPSSGSGDLYVAAKEEFEVEIGRLLAEK